MNKYTPQLVSEDEGLSFSIPLYQRLFEWGEEQITQLLDDLYAAYKRNPNAAYYIGMLTAKETGESKELVDGQQRFTVMLLLGIHFGWNEFLQVDNEPRLQFTARDEDKQYLKAKIQGIVPSYKNDKMEKGLEYMSSHLKKGLKLDESEEKQFGEYIFNHLTFFISQLPEGYSPQELNTYFERMNTSGKALENYEILKVDVIRRLPEKKETYTLLWNAVSIMDKTILRLHNGEKPDYLRSRYLKAMSDIFKSQNVDSAFENSQTKFPIDDDGDIEFKDNTAPKTIGEIEENYENPFKIIKRRNDEHSLLTFPEFLLQVLYVCLDMRIAPMNITDFFDVRKLNNTFSWAFDKRGLDASKFMQKLGLYRLLMDYFIVRIDDDGDDPYPFVLYKADESGKMKVRMFLSMLYSASSAMTYYMWMPVLLKYLEDYVCETDNLELDAQDYLKKLKEIDNAWHPMENSADYFTYSTIDRYWFWRIDYYLWEHRDLFFSKDDVKVVEKYVFRRNRSIEHIAPQHPKEEYGDNTRFNWNNEEQQGVEQKRDCLGNMVMISSSQNSSLTNSCFEVKRVVMERYASGKGNGTVESLKMLYVYSKYKEWSIENIDDHQKFSMKFLESTYEDDPRKWKEFAQNVNE